MDKAFQAMPPLAAHERGYRNGYYDGFCACAEAVEGLRWLKTWARIRAALLTFSMTLRKWRMGDPGKIVRPPAVAVKCSYCSAPAEVLDHIVPRCKGGQTTEDNLQPACRDCNLSKSGYDLADWLARRAPNGR